MLEHACPAYTLPLPPAPAQAQVAVRAAGLLRHGGSQRRGAAHSAPVAVETAGDQLAVTCRERVLPCVFAWNIGVRTIASALRGSVQSVRPRSRHSRVSARSALTRTRSCYTPQVDLSISGDGGGGGGGGHRAAHRQRRRPDGVRGGPGAGRGHAGVGTGHPRRRARQEARVRGLYPVQVPTAPHSMLCAGSSGWMVAGCHWQKLHLTRLAALQPGAAAEADHGGEAIRLGKGALGRHRLWCRVHTFSSNNRPFLCQACAHLCSAHAHSTHSQCSGHAVMLLICKAALCAGRSQAQLSHAP